MCTNLVVDLHLFNLVTEMTSTHCDTIAYTSQALAAATNTVESTKIVHNLHSYFLLVGDITSKDTISM